MLGFYGEIRMDEDIDPIGSSFNRVTRYKNNPFSDIMTWIVIGAILLIVPVILAIVTYTAKLTDAETISMLEDRGYTNIMPTSYEPTFTSGQCPYRPGGYQIGRDFTANIDGHYVKGVLCTGTLKTAPEVIVLYRHDVRGS